MKETRLIMGMPITVEIIGTVSNLHEAVFAYFTEVDEKFSTYKETSEISRINASTTNTMAAAQAFTISEDMLEVLDLAEKTKEETRGYFDIKKPDGTLDPSGIVKGWAIKKASELLQEKGVENFYIEAGGDIQTSGLNSEGIDWSVGIRNPFNTKEIVKVIYPRGKGVATSGNYERGAHIYNPLDPTDTLREIVSITVIGPDVLEADRFATAAFAMGPKGIEFIETLDEFEAYSIDKRGIATMTSNFASLIK